MFFFYFLRKNWSLLQKKIQKRLLLWKEGTPCEDELDHSHSSTTNIYLAPATEWRDAFQAAQHTHQEDPGVQEVQEVQVVQADLGVLQDHQAVGLGFLSLLPGRVVQVDLEVLVTLEYGMQQYFKVQRWRVTWIQFTEDSLIRYLAEYVQVRLEVPGTPWVLGHRERQEHRCSQDLLEDLQEERYGSTQT